MRVSVDTRAVQAGSLAVRGLRTVFASRSGPLTAVDGVDLDLAPGEILGLVGESGSGKSVTLRSLLRLVHPPGRVAGQVLWGGRDLLALRDGDLRRVRGREIATVFQEPMTALNPVLTVGRQIDESLRAHTALDARGRRARSVELLDLVGIPAPAGRLGDYPHQFSGGMRQRAMIAIALAGEPRLLLADEPTTALDVTIQDQILKLILGLRTRLGMGVILVTHDLGVVAQSCDRVAVMYAGRIVETGPVAERSSREPRHAYTRGPHRLGAAGRGRAPPPAVHRRHPARPRGRAPRAAPSTPAAASRPTCAAATRRSCRRSCRLWRARPAVEAACWHHAAVAAAGIEAPVRPGEPA